VRLQDTLRTERQVYQLVDAPHVPTISANPTVLPPPLGPDVSARLHSLATGGAPIQLSPTFQPNRGASKVAHGSV
jgi:hypothetical protein